MSALKKMPPRPLSSCLLALLALVLCAHPALADDGSWTTERGYSPSEGALYAETGSPDVVMEKEYLELRDLGLGSTRAVFQFQNVSTEAVTAQCAFPIRFDFAARPVTLDEKGGLVPENDARASFKAWDIGDVVRRGVAAGQPSGLDDKGFLKSLLAAVSVRTDPWNAPAGDEYFAGTYVREEQYPRGTKEIDPADLRRLLGFHIRQDGRELPVEICVADFGAAPGQLVLRFRFQLVFAAGAASTASVDYAMPTRSAESADPGAPRAPGVDQRFTWNYVLETASSWKDPVGRIVLAVPPGFQQDLEAPWQYLGTENGQLFYAAENWKPTSADNLSLEWRATVADYPDFWRHVTEPLDPADLLPVDSPATLLGASSFLPERADVFLPQGIWRNAPFDAARLFDGLRETAWVVRTPRGGVGEYVRFSLDSDVGRIEIFNGWQRSAVNFPDKDTWSYFEKNNRVKALDIVRDDGSLVQRLALADTREVQRFNTSLPAGIYRAVIVDIYPGSRWNDTCLGELTFVRGIAAGFDEVNRDPFFSPLLK
ncbi:MAG: NADase-type glycan-binding domain-containing protein [Spirochaetia bacterium]